MNPKFPDFAAPPGLLLYIPQKACDKTLLSRGSCAVSVGRANSLDVPYNTLFLAYFVTTMM